MNTPYFSHMNFSSFRRNGRNKTRLRENIINICWLSTYHEHTLQFECSMLCRCFENCSFLVYSFSPKFNTMQCARETEKANIFEEMKEPPVKYNFYISHPITHTQIHENIDEVFCIGKHIKYIFECMNLCKCSIFRGWISIIRAPLSYYKTCAHFAWDLDETVEEERLPFKFFFPLSVETEFTIDHLKYTEPWQWQWYWWWYKPPFVLQIAHRSSASAFFFQFYRLVSTNIELNNLQIIAKEKLEIVSEAATMRKTNIAEDRQKKKKKI